MFSKAFLVLPKEWLVLFTVNYMWLYKGHMAKHNNFLAYDGPVHASMSS